ncbi:MAG: DEAD/DEAH box helicase family protein, partial [Candidatus Heimdallarchaeaceae archaeon]
MESNRIENREYQNYIIDRILTSVNCNRNVILELDCGMGKRVIIYRLIAEAFLKEKILIFLQNQSSLQETEDYLNNRYGGLEDLGVVHSKHSSIQRKYILENSRIILTLPLSFMNTIKKYPNIASSFKIVIINEIDTIIRRVSYKTVLRNPWKHIISRFSHCKFIGMSGTLRDYHTISSDKKVFKRKELST